MNTLLPKINPEQEAKRIIAFLKKTFKEQNIEKTVIGISGGIDSATSLYLLLQVLPKENIIALHLPYFDNFSENIQLVAQTSGVKIETVSIKPVVDVCISTLGVEVRKNTEEKVRIGNIAARIRMITLYDIAKKENALVCGTENKSEYHLAYFTRFGDEASDIEPIQHLYKTQVSQLAKHLGIPEEIIEKAPTAGLWEDQTDEGQFGFTYEEADQVLFLYFEQKLTVEEIEKKGLSNAKKIIEWCDRNSYKHHVPYVLKY